MKFTIMGFNQQSMIDLKLDLKDAMILRYFVDFKGSNNMKTTIHNNEEYYWLYYEKVIEDIPMIKIKDTTTLGRRLKVLCSKGLLERFIDKQKNSMTYYKLGMQYERLINSKTDKVNKPVSKSKEEPKHKYGEFKHILLTDKQLESLKNKFTNWEWHISNLDEAIEMHGYKYQNHYLTMLKWAKSDKKKQQSKKPKMQTHGYEDIDANVWFDNLDSVEI